MSLRVGYDERAVGQAAAFLEDPQGLHEVLDAIGRLADDPRPAGSFPYGSPDLRRLRIRRAVNERAPLRVHAETPAEPGNECLMH